MQLIKNPSLFISMNIGSTTSAELSSPTSFTTATLKKKTVTTCNMTGLHVLEVEIAAPLNDDCGSSSSSTTSSLLKSSASSVVAQHSSTTTKNTTVKVVSPPAQLRDSSRRGVEFFLEPQPTSPRKSRGKTRKSRGFSLFSSKKTKPLQPKEEAVVVVVDAPKHDTIPDSMAAVEDIDFYLIALELGEGAMRFAPTPGEQPTVEQQVAALSTTQRQVYQSLKKRWDDSTHSRKKKPYNPTLDDVPDYMFLRFARFSAAIGDGGEFREDRAWKALKKYDHRYFHMTARKMESQLLTKTLFPVPGLKTKAGGHGMFYMRPSRYVPSEMPTKSVIDNLAYVIHTMMERSCHVDTHGIGFIACMDDWTMKNFDIDYCLQFMMMLQGYVIPVKVQLFLIVNPPSWFDVIWKIMKSMLAPSFRKKVKMIPQRDLHKYLQDGYLSYLPDDMQGGQANTEDLVRDFVSYQCYKDEQNPDWDNGVSPYSEMFPLTKSSNHHQQHSYHGESSSDGMSSSFGVDVDDDSTLLPTDPFAWRRNQE